MKEENPSYDPAALRRDKEMTPAARLDWLAAALEFAREVERGNPATRRLDRPCGAPPRTGTNARQSA